MQGTLICAMSNRNQIPSTHYWCHQSDTLQTAFSDLPCRGTQPASLSQGDTAVNNNNTSHNNRSSISLDTHNDNSYSLIPQDLPRLLHAQEFAEPSGPMNFTFVPGHSYQRSECMTSNIPQGTEESSCCQRCGRGNPNASLHSYGQFGVGDNMNCGNINQDMTGEQHIRYQAPGNNFGQFHHQQHQMIRNQMPTDGFGQFHFAGGWNSTVMSTQNFPLLTDTHIIPSTSTNPHIPRHFDFMAVPAQRSSTSLHGYDHTGFSHPQPATVDVTQQQQQFPFRYQPAPNTWPVAYEASTTISNTIIDDPMDTDKDNAKATDATSTTILGATTTFTSSHSILSSDPISAAGPCEIHPATSASISNPPFSGTEPLSIRTVTAPTAKINPEERLDLSLEDSDSDSEAEEEEGDEASQDGWTHEQDAALMLFKRAEVKHKKIVKAFSKKYRQRKWTENMIAKRWKRLQENSVTSQVSAPCLYVWLRP